MSARPRSAPAPLFAALGDETRLELVAKLGSGAPRSLSQLTDGTGLTRQGISKHLRVLEGAGLVRSVKQGRETIFALEPEPLDEARAYLAALSAQWDQALERLRSFVED